jgi:hypothetical protein
MREREIKTETHRRTTLVIDGEKTERPGKKPALFLDFWSLEP